MTDSKDAADLVALVADEIRRRVDSGIWPLAGQPGPDNIDAAALRFHCAAILGFDTGPAAVAYTALADRDRKAATQVVLDAAGQVAREREPRKPGRLDRDQPDTTPVRAGLARRRDPR